MRHLAAAACAVFIACSAQAQPIYRCGAEYSQTPCPGAKVLEASDPRSAAQRSEAVRVAAQDRRKAAELERERRAMEKATPPTRAAGIVARSTPPDEAASATERKAKKRSRPRADAAFVAVEPVKPKAPKAQ